MVVGGLAVVLGMLPHTARGFQDTDGADSAPTERWIGVSFASHAIALGAEQDGLIVDMPIREGQVVEEGQVLFKLSSREQEIRAKRLSLLADSDVLVRRARTELAFAQGEQARTAELAHSDVASRTDLAAREFELSIAKIRLEEAELEQRSRQFDAEDAAVKLAQRTIHSPMRAIVAKQLFARGQTIERLDPVVELIELDPLWIEFDCPLEDEGFFEPGARLQVRRATMPKEIRTATVIHAPMQADPSSSTFRVRLSIANGQQPWRAGLKMWIEPIDSNGLEASPPK